MRTEHAAALRNAQDCINARCIGSFPLLYCCHAAKISSSVMLHCRQPLEPPAGSLRTPCPDLGCSIQQRHFYTLQSSTSRSFAASSDTGRACNQPSCGGVVNPPGRKEGRYFNNRTSTAGPTTGTFQQRNQGSPKKLETVLLGPLRNYDEDFERKYSTSLFALLFIASSKGVWPQRSLTFRSALPCSTSILVCAQAWHTDGWSLSDAAKGGPDECSTAYCRDQMLSTPLQRPLFVAWAALPRSWVQQWQSA